MGKALGSKNLMVAFLTMNAADCLLQSSDSKYIKAGSFPISNFIVPMLSNYDASTLYFIERFCWWFHIIGILLFMNYIVIVMNNQSWGAEKAYQKDFFGKRYLGADITSPSFDKVAELYGAKGFKVKKISEISEAVRAAIKSNKPSVIDVDVDPKALYSFRRDSFKHRVKK